MSKPTPPQKKEEDTYGLTFWTSKEWAERKTKTKQRLQGRCAKKDLPVHMEPAKKKAKRTGAFRDPKKVRFHVHGPPKRDIQTSPHARSSWGSSLKKISSTWGSSQKKKNANQTRIQHIELVLLAGNLHLLKPLHTFSCDRFLQKGNMFLSKCK